MADEPMETAPQTNESTTETLVTKEAEAPKTEETPAGEKAADAPKTEDAQKPEGAPEAYDFKAAEGQEYDGEFIKVYSEIAKELNLSQENAQELLDKVSPVVQQRQLEKINEIREGWAASSKTDKEFGGDKFKENLALAKQALNELGTPELKTFLDNSGLGNHPELIRLLYRAGKAITPDHFVGGPKGEKKPEPKTFSEKAEALYPQ